MIRGFGVVDIKREAGWVQVTVQEETAFFPSVLFKNEGPGRLHSISVAVSAVFKEQLVVDAVMEALEEFLVKEETAARTDVSQIPNASRDQGGQWDSDDFPERRSKR